MQKTGKFGTKWLGLKSFNELSDRAAMNMLFQVCSSPIWARRVAAGRPYASDVALCETASQILAELTEPEIDYALEGHPRIGDRPDTASSTHEQRGVIAADPEILEQLKVYNKLYEDKFGHVYLVFANGRPASELLEVLKDRMNNDAAAERRILRFELAKINSARLERMLQPHDPDIHNT